MCILPDVLIDIIHSYLELSEFLSRKNIKKCCRDKSCFYLTLHSETYPNCKDLHIFYTLTNKYNYYQKHYEDFCERNKSNGRGANQAPVLLDMLLSGCALPLAMSTFPRFTEAMEEDIKTILRIAPNTLKTTYGQLRCRQNISPLDAACVNTAVPFSVIQTLMDHGADIYHKISLNGYPIHIIYDLEDNYRKKVITKMFRKNGFIDVDIDTGGRDDD